MFGANVKLDKALLAKVPSLDPGLVEHVGAGDQVAHLHTELARRYAGKPQPAVDRELEAAEQAIALWQALWEQYSACLKPLLEGDPDLAGVKAKLLQRGLFVGNSAATDGGAIQEGGPVTTITGSELLGNSAAGAGGGIFANGVTLTVTASP